MRRTNRRGQKKNYRECQRGEENNESTTFGSRTACRKSSSPAYANVFKPHGAQPGRIQQVFRVHDDGLLEQLLDAVKVESAEFRPAGADDESIHPFCRRVG